MSHTRTPNHQIGVSGEKRIIKKLEDLGAIITENGKHRDIPDIRFTVGNKEYAAELKTLLILYDGGTTGSVKMNRTEFQDMESLQGEKCMIVEIRSRTKRNHAYQFVPWKRVEAYFSKKNPRQATLGLNWILRNGLNLDYWIDIPEVAAV